MSLVKHHKRRGKKSNLRKPYGKSATYYNQRKYAMYRSPRPYMPQEYVTTLRYNVIYDMVPVASTTTGIYFQSSPFDVDPKLGNVALAGFQQLSAVYARCRPLRLSYKFIVSNNESFPLVVTSGFTSETLANTGVKMSGNPLWKQKQISAKGGMDRCVLKDSATIVKIAGTKQALFDDIYTSATTANTLTGSGINYAYLCTESTGVQVSGVTASCHISLTIQFYRFRMDYPV